MVDSAIVYESVGIHSIRSSDEKHGKVMTVEETADRTVVTTHLTGDFAGSPVILCYQVKLANAEIIALEIG